jgi:hypothetical protein
MLCVFLMFVVADVGENEFLLVMLKQKPEAPDRYQGGE